MVEIRREEGTSRLSSADQVQRRDVRFESIRNHVVRRRTSTSARKLGRNPAMSSDLDAKRIGVDGAELILHPGELNGVGRA